jgi:hypothetical protein
MEDSFYFVVSEEGRFVSGGLGHVSTDEPEMWGAWARSSGFKEVHPGSSTF